MKTLPLLFVIFQLAVAASNYIAPIVVDSNKNLCPTKEVSKKAIESIKNFTVDITSKFWKLPQCGDGLWYQLVRLNMSTTDSQCPGGWVEENEGGVRACGRGTVGGSCQSAILNVSDYQNVMEYTRVCGRAIGYQYGNTDAFGAQGGTRTIDQVYVDGLSITYGSPRQHLWTYAAGVSEVRIGQSYTLSNCPCSSSPGKSPPLYLGNNWYCESGNPSTTSPMMILLQDDPLWDGENCEGTCCSNGKSPPWFSVELPGPTKEYIEARICANEHSDRYEDVFINIFEVYIQ